jgi:hypothetical protein
LAELRYTALSVVELDGSRGIIGIGSPSRMIEMNDTVAVVGGNGPIELIFPMRRQFSNKRRCKKDGQASAPSSVTLT